MTENTSLTFNCQFCGNSVVHDNLVSGGHHIVQCYCGCMMYEVIDGDATPPPVCSGAELPEDCMNEDNYVWQMRPIDPGSLINCEIDDGIKESE